MISPTPSSLLGARSNTLLASYQIFSELAGCKSMSEAAWNLDVDVSVVSRHIAAVEHTFGCLLFDRHGRGVRLTSAGQAVAEHISAVLQGKSRVRQQLSELQDLRCGLLRIIGTDGAIASPVSQAVTAFSARYPGVLFELYRASSELIVSAVKDGRADIGAGLNLQPEAEVELASRLDDQLAAVMCPAHPLASKSSVHLCELSRYPIGTFERNSGVGRALQRLAKTEGVSHSPALVTNALDALKHFCSVETNISLLCVHSVQAELATGARVAVPLAGANGPVRMRLDVCVARNPLRSFAVSAFLKCLQEECGFEPVQAEVGSAMKEIMAG